MLTSFAKRFSSVTEATGLELSYLERLLARSFFKLLTVNYRFPVNGGPVAQLVEHRPFKAAAESSSLSRLTTDFRFAKISEQSNRKSIFPLVPFGDFGLRSAAQKCF